ncbi:MAG: hypothetical protein PHG57_05995 [Eubacteriales bacterium]|nr:hypothetical protein [Eubacteriales bacterium]
MKKTLLIVALVLAITTSIIAGTMAYYTITLDDLVKGEVVAKEFILEGENTSTHQESVKIAPGESLEWTFNIKNFDANDAVTDTDMDVTIDVDLQDLVEVNDITVPLEVSYTLDTSVVASEDGTFSKLFTAGENATKTLTVTVEWPWETEGVDDIDFAGQNLGTLSVSVTGTQSETTTTTTP